MLRRAIGIFLGFGFLAATGVASGKPCCTLIQLAGPAVAGSPDCCDNPDCRMGEKRGPAQATLAARAPKAASPAAFLPVPPVLSRRAAGKISIAFGEPLVVSDHSPPLDRRETRLLISLFRI
jgi:hypothetical protein